MKLCCQVFGQGFVSGHKELHSLSLCWSQILVNLQVCRLDQRLRKISTVGLSYPDAQLLHQRDEVNKVHPPPAAKLKHPDAIALGSPGDMLFQHFPVNLSVIIFQEVTDAITSSFLRI